MASAPTEIRTPVLALKGLRPGPLDDGGLSGGDFTIPGQAGQAFCELNRRLIKDLVPRFDRFQLSAVVITVRIPARRSFLPLALPF